MRGAMLVIWLMVPVAVGAYHYGPGQDQMQLDDAQSLLAAARDNVQQGRHAEAAELFTQALAVLPKQRVAEARRIRLERAKAHLLSRQLPEAYNELEVLLTELQEDSTTEPALLADARETQASAKYYLTWLMRLEGRPREDWEPEIEAARQSYRLLAEQATDQQNSTAAARHQEDMEAAIRLARMDLSELQALPLPSQCQGCKSGQCNCQGKGKGKGKSQKKKQGESDARGASSGPPPDGSGN